LTPDHVAATLVTLLPLVYFFPAVRGRLVISPDDGVIFNVPLRVAAAELVRAGHLPLWNPYLFGGMPLHGAAQAGLLFPLNWFYLVFSPPVATNLMMLSSYALAALGAYLYARRTGTTLAGALATGIVWQLSAFLVNQIGHTNILQTAAMLPWVLWAVDGYGMMGTRGRGLWLAALVALQAFTGHQQTFVYSMLLAAAYAVCMALAAKRTRTFYLRSLAFLAAGGLLAAVQILPTFELLRNSLRATATYDFFTSFSMPRRFVLTLVAPYLMGGGDGHLFRAPYVGPPFYAEYVGYVGLLTLMLAVVAVLQKPDARTKFWAVVSLVCLALACGRFLPFDLYRLVYYIPVLNLFRVPARHLMEVEFALAVLAGRGLTVVAAAHGDAGVRRRAALIAAIFILLTCVVVIWGRPQEFQLGRRAPVSLLRAPELFLPILVALVSGWALCRAARGKLAIVWLLAVLALDLAVWGQASGWRTHSPTMQSELWRTPATISFLHEREAQSGSRAPYRILTTQHSFNPDRPMRRDESVLSLQPDIYMMHGVENAAGYDGFGLARYSRLAGDMKVWGELPDPERTLRGPGRAVDLLNVRYLLALKSDQSSSAQLPLPTYPPATETYGGQPFAAEDLNAPTLEMEEHLSFSVPPVEADRLALLTNLAWSQEISDGTVVGHVRLYTNEGRAYDFALRAGEHTSEWSYDRPDVRAQIRHRRATVATSYEVVDAQGSYQAHTYLSSFTLPRREIIAGVEISVARSEQSPRLVLGIQRVSLADGSKGYPLRREWLRKEATPSMGQYLKPQPVRGPNLTRWRRLAQVQEVEIFENTQVLPRAWLASGELVAGEQQELEIIHTGTLTGGQPWNPLQTALVESPTGINLAGGSPTGQADVTRHGPNHVAVKTASTAPAILVLSENHYPGWRATVDGREVEVLRVNYNLRGVLLPAGEHTVEFVYRPRSVLLGLIISLLVLASLVLWRVRLWSKWRVRRIPHPTGVK
jgi:hypothetical protein